MSLALSLHIARLHWMAGGYLTSHFQIPSEPHTHFKELRVYTSIIKNQIPSLIHKQLSTLQSMMCLHAIYSVP